MRKYKKSNWLTALLFVYITAMAVYFLPRNTQTGITEKYLTIGGSYVILLLLWVVLRQKERLAAEREKEMEESRKQKQNHLNDRI